MHGIDSIPGWADKALSHPAHDAYEVEILRAFYAAWEALHAIPKDKMHRNMKEQAAADLLSARDAVRLFDRPVHARTA